jgi:hypothetical protein
LGRPGGRKVPHDDEAQSRAFIETAREIEADYKQSVADRLMGALANKSPEPRQKPKRRAKKARKK